jgi:arylformamidase
MSQLGFGRWAIAAVFVLIAAVAAVSVKPVLADPAVPDATKKTEKAEKDRSSEKPVLSEKTVVRADVPYGKDQMQRLDVYAPRDAEDAPIVVFFHRGEWTKGDKSEAAYKPKFLNENGVVFVSANYRLSPAVKHPAHINDVAAAVRWVYDHAGEFGGSNRKMVLMGHSAGCHLVTLLALDPRYLAGVKLRPSDLCGAVAWSGGAYDLVAKVKAGGTYGPYIKQAFGDSEAAWRDASPVAHVGDAKPMPPFLFVSVLDKGKKDSMLAAKNLAGLIRAAGGRATTKALEGRTHLTANALIGAPGDATSAILLDFVRQATR